jgi:hypothetical protein
MHFPQFVTALIFASLTTALALPTPEVKVDVTLSTDNMASDCSKLHAQGNLGKRVNMRWNDIGNVSSLYNEMNKAD